MKTIDVYIYKEDKEYAKWEWWCYPWLNVRVSGLTRTPDGARRAAKRTLERMGFKAKVKILRPNRTCGTYG